MIKVKGYEHYFGGKSGGGTFQILINHIPPHDVFYSLFLGNCGVTRHIRPAQQNILCDLDIDVVAAWDMVIGDHWNYRISNTSAFDILAALAKSCDATGINQVAAHKNAMRDPIAEKCDVINQDRHAEKCDTSSFDKPELTTQKNAIRYHAKHFIFLDPPYRLTSRRSQRAVYKFEMTDAQHADLLEIVTKMPKGINIMITHYPDPVYDMWLHDWVKKDFYSMTRNGLQLERMYMNYEMGDELHDYSFLGDDFREREKFNRIKNNFIKKLKRLPAPLRNSILSSIAEICDTAGK